jgi:hypothetical protein
MYDAVIVGGGIAGIFLRNPERETEYEAPGAAPAGECARCGWIGGPGVSRAESVIVYIVAPSSGRGEHVAGLLFSARISWSKSGWNRSGGLGKDFGNDRDASLLIQLGELIDGAPNAVVGRFVTKAAIALRYKATMDEIDQQFVRGLGAQVQTVGDLFGSPRDAWVIM